MESPPALDKHNPADNIQTKIAKIKMIQAKDCKCINCRKQAVAFYPNIDIPQHPYCRKCLDKLKDIQTKIAKEWKDKAIKYQKGFNILIEYFDSISDEEKPEVDRKLNKLGLW